MSKILITGAAGFIGSNLINTLLKQECEIAVINRSDNPNFKNIKKYIGDICDYSFLEKAISDFQPNKVFHLAAYKNRSSAVEDMSKALKVNLIGTLNIYQALLNVTGTGVENARKFITMLTHVGETVSKAMTSLAEMNTNIQEMHKELAELETQIQEAPEVEVETATNETSK